VAVSNAGLTTTVDLVSAQFVGRNTTGNATDNDQVVYTFDQGSGPDQHRVPRLLRQRQLGDRNGRHPQQRQHSRAGELRRCSADRRGGCFGQQQQRRHGFRDDRPASVGVAPVRTGTSGRTPGQVDAPELRSVAISTSTNALNVVSTTATYTFDQAINPASIASTSFLLYNANGNRLVGAAGACTPPTNASTTTNTQVVCTAFTGSVVGTSTAQETAAAATLGAVLPGAVAGAAGSGNTNTNPAGAEITTGGTGTRQ
jgi:hypothetical protein